MPARLMWITVHIESTDRQARIEQQNTLIHPALSETWWGFEAYFACFDHLQNARPFRCVAREARLCGTFCADALRDTAHAVRKHAVEVAPGLVAANIKSSSRRERHARIRILSQQDTTHVGRAQLIECPEHVRAVRCAKLLYSLSGGKDRLINAQFQVRIDLGEAKFQIIENALPFRVEILNPPVEHCRECICKFDRHTGPNRS